MFFSITREPDLRFPCSDQFDNFYFNSDRGWQHHAVGCTEIFHKGYPDNFCRVLLNSRQVKLEHNTFRTFPLWYDQNCVTNLPAADLQQAWADDQLIMDASRVRAEKSPLDLTVPNTGLALDQALAAVSARLDRKVHELKKITKHPIKLFCSGGLDTMLLYALFNYHQVPYELILDSWYESDDFTSNNQLTLKQFWAYQQIHHWTAPTWLATGSCGDEYFLRGPAVLAMLTAWHDIDFGTLLDNNPSCYHYHYFKKYTDLWQQTWQDRHQLKSLYPNLADLYKQILNVLSNDHQHWHLGDTLTWTPFNDIEIARALLGCDVKDLIDQFLDGAVTKKLIAHYDPSALRLLSQFKNQNPQENIKKLLENQ